VPEYRFFATALALQNQTGGGLSETLENLAEVIRKRVGLKARARALASEAKTSAGILAALPFLTGAVLAVVNFDYVSLLFNDPGGQQVLTVALIMLGVGIMVMRSIIRRSLA
jgi:tight adherence protein B